MQLGPTRSMPGQIRRLIVRPRASWTYAFFGIWLFGISLAGSRLACEGPGSDLASTGVKPAVMAAAREARYFFGSDCGLSASAAASLAHRGPLPTLKEQIFLTAELPDSEQLLRSAGFKVQQAGSDPTRLHPFPTGGGPWLQLANTRGEILFNGPYHSF